MYGYLKCWLQVSYQRLWSKRRVFETCRLLPESVVWLCANNRVAEAEQIIRNAAKLNNVTMPDKILARSHTVEISEEKTDDTGKNNRGTLLEKYCNPKSSSKSKKVEDGSARYTLLDIFRNRRLTISMFCMLLLWLVTLFYTNTLFKIPRDSASSMNRASDTTGATSHQ